MRKSEEKKIDTFHINADNKATIVCPGCGRTKVIDATRYLGKNSPVRIRLKFTCRYCERKHSASQNAGTDGSAAYTHVITLERRKFYRKTVNLPGTFTDQRGKKGDILIVDLSRTGLKFKMEYPWPLALEAPLLLTFHLDNPAKPLITKDARIKKIEDLLVSVEFSSVNSFSESDKAIGFYLMN